MASVAKTELEALNLLQQEMHMPMATTNEIESNVFEKDYPIAWYSKHKTQFDHSVTENKVKFTLPDKASSFLVRSYLRQTLPALSVKPEVKDVYNICWSPYPAYACVIDAELKLENNEPIAFPRQAYDIHHQYFRKNSIEHYNIRAGHVSSLIEWTTSLPEYTCNVLQPFFYARSFHDALPLNLNSAFDTTSVNHIYTIRNKVKDILRMRKQDEDGEWMEIPVDFSVLNGVQDLPTPMLWGNFLVNTNEEIDEYRCSKEGFTRVFDDIIHITSSNTERMKDGQFTRQLTECSMPCKYMVWLCENINATGNRCFSNYTTDPENIHTGRNPISTSSLTYGGKFKKFSMLANDHFELDEVEFFPSEPVDKGYLAWSNSLCPSDRIDVGVIYKDVTATMQVVLDSDESNMSKFMLHILMYVTRKITYTKDKNDRFTVTITS